MAGSIVQPKPHLHPKVHHTPRASAVGMGYTVIPITMGNVKNLAWKIEERFAPLVIKDMQGRIGREAERVWETGKAHSGMAVARLEEGAQGG